MQFQRVKGVYLIALVGLPVSAAVASGLAFETKDECTKHGFLCGAAGGVVGIALAAVLGLGGFIWLSEHVRREYLKLARRKPQELFPPAIRRLPMGEPMPSVEDVFATIAPSWRGRRRLDSWLIRIWSMLWPAESIPPQLLVGQAGEGKTTLLLQLTKRLADADFIPVPVSLRDVDSFSGFLDLGRVAFQATVDEQLASNDEGDRIWRWICWSGRLVILADDLQLLHDTARARLPHAFLEAEERNYALVVTSRRDGVGSALEQWRVPLRQLTAEKAVEVTDPAGTLDAELLRKLISSGNLNESRYYLSVLHRLVAEKVALPAELPAGGTRLEIRRWLFESYIDAFLAHTLTPKDGVDDLERAEALDEIQLACYEALGAGTEAIVRGSRDGFTSATQAGLLRSLDGDEAQIEHALLQSYLASQAVGDTDRWEKLVRNEAGTPEARDALLFHAGVPARQEDAEKIVTALLQRARDRSDARISTVLVAADIAIAADLEDQDPIVKAIGRVWPAAGALERRGLVERLALLAPEQAIELLWKNSDDGSYHVSWACGCALVGQPSPAHMTRATRAEDAARILKRGFEEVIDAGEEFLGEIARREEDMVDDWDPRVRRLKRLGWILPVLAVGSSDRSIREGLERVLGVFGLRAGETTDGLTVQRGPEASIAQGFKAAARLAAWGLPERPSDRTLEALFRQLLNLHARARFWYARLVLIQGLTDLVIAVERGRPVTRALEDEAELARKTIKDQAWRQRCATARPDATGAHPPGFEHPFVVEAANLCDTALWRIDKALRQPGEDMDRLLAIRERLIWDDEGVAVSTPTGVLDAQALRLLGDVAVLLNLNEKGPPTRPGGPDDVELRAAFGVNDYLPTCLGEAGARNRIVSRKCKDCLFERCPYPERAQRAHREMSKLFCRHVLQQVDGVGAPRWQPKLGQLAYRRFWMRMERKAKYGG